MNRILMRAGIALAITLATSAGGWGIYRWIGNKHIRAINEAVTRDERILNHKLNPRLNKALRKDQEWARGYLK